MIVMPQANIRDEFLQKLNARVGDTIRIKKDGKIYEGILMPHHEFSGEDILVIKLRNGYNVGIRVTKETKMKIIKKLRKLPSKKKRDIPYDPNKPTISILGTGGTIACYADYRTGAVNPATTAEELAFSVPEIFDICNIRTKIIFQMLSEDIGPSHWKILAKEIAREFNENRVAGVVIPHGTDTMGYTAPALSFMLKNLSGPVVLVGAQRSSDRPSSDAMLNLMDATRVASQSDLGEVVVVMHGEISDSFTLIHRGTKVRKLHTSRRDAFKTVNEPPLGKVLNGIITLNSGYIKKSDGRVTVDSNIEEDVGIVYFYPGIKPEDIPDKKGIIIMGTGLGHVSRLLFSRVKELIKDGSTVVMTSQCIFGRVNLNVYSTGRDLLKLGVIPAGNMLPETAYVKLMWVLAHAKSKEEIRKLMLTNIAGEISPRTTIYGF